MFCVVNQSHFKEESIGKERCLRDVKYEGIVYVLTDDRTLLLFLKTGQENEFFRSFCREIICKRWCESSNVRNSLYYNAF